MPSFDAYHKWLGIRPEEQPANHYRLLGINLFEADPDVIASAADQRMGHVRSFQTGAHAAFSQRILNELAGARVCLLNPSKKIAYDQTLRVQQAPPASPAIEPPVGVIESRFPDLGFTPTYKKKKPSKKATPFWIPWALAGVGGLAAAWLLMMIANIGRESPKAAKAGPTVTLKERSKPSSVNEEPKTNDSRDPEVLAPKNPKIKHPPKPRNPKLTLLKKPSPLPDFVASEVDFERNLVQEPDTLHPASRPKPEESPEVRVSIPNADAQAKALANIREIYKGEDRAALAQKLLAKAHETRDVTDRFVLLREAKDAASETWQGELAFETIDRIASEYEVSVAQMKAEVLDQAAKRPRITQEQKTAIANAALNVMDEAVDEDNFEVAKKLSRLASQLLQQTKNKGILQELVERNKKIAAADKAYVDAQEAMDVLKKKPGDPDANATVGKYLCLKKDDWEKGLPKLVLGSDHPWKALAEKDLAGADSAEDCVKLGDAWWDASTHRAAYWYRRALPDLGGLEKDRVEKRVSTCQAMAELNGKTSAPISVEVVSFAAVSNETFTRVLKIPVQVDATSFFNMDYRPEFAADGKPETEFALRGSRGTIGFDLGRGVRCSMIVLRSRNDRRSVMEEGVVVVNGRDRVPFEHFGGGDLLVVKPGRTVRTVTLESIRGEGNPGIAETYFIK